MKRKKFQFQRQTKAVTTKVKIITGDSYLNINCVTYYIILQKYKEFMMTIYIIDANQECIFIDFQCFTNTGIKPILYYTLFH